MKLERIKSWWQRLKTTGKSGVIISFISVLLLELFEESIEEMIAWGISVVVTKALSVVFVLTITQTIKLAIKKTIKLITYRKGADKMNKLKDFFKKLVDYFRANPLVMGTSGLNLASSSAVGYAVYTAIGHFGWDLPEWGVYLIVAFVSVLMACLVEWGIVNVGWETIEQKEARCQARADAKAAKAETKRIEKEAKAALDAEAAEVAKIEADAKAALDAEAKAKADAEKAEADAKAEAEHKARVQAKIEELRNQN